MRPAFIALSPLDINFLSDVHLPREPFGVLALLGKPPFVSAARAGNKLSSADGLCLEGNQTRQLALDIAPWFHRIPIHILSYFDKFDSVFMAFIYSALIVEALHQ